MSRTTRSDTPTKKRASGRESRRAAAETLAQNGARRATRSNPGKGPVLEVDACPIPLHQPVPAKLKPAFDKITKDVIESWGYWKGFSSPKVHEHNTKKGEYWKLMGQAVVFTDNFKKKHFGLICGMVFPDDVDEDGDHLYYIDNTPSYLWRAVFVDNGPFPGCDLDANGVGSQGPFQFIHFNVLLDIMERGWHEHSKNGRRPFFESKAFSDMKEHYTELQQEMDDKHAAELVEYNTLMETETNETHDSDDTDVDKGNRRRTKKRKRKLGPKKTDEKARKTRRVEKIL